MPNNKRHFPWILVIVSISLVFIYALLRYHFYGTTELKDTPLYIVNKVLSVNAVIFFIAYLFRRENSYLGGLSYLFIIAHILLSILLLQPAYYPGFFDPSFRFTGQAKLNIFFGVLSYTGFWVYHQIKKGNRLYTIISNNKLRTLILISIGFHLVFTGAKTWLTPHNWYGGLPPLTLITFIILLLGFFRKI